MKLGPYPVIEFDCYIITMVTMQFVSCDTNNISSKACWAEVKQHNNTGDIDFWDMYILQAPFYTDNFNATTQ